MGGRRCSLVEFTSNAATRVQKLITRNGNLKLKLRVFIQGGGCSGFQYGFKLDEHQPDDTSIDTNGVTMLVDPMSLQYLMGSQIDYKDGLSGARFMIKNPNASATCGCGSSFTN